MILMSLFLVGSKSSNTLKPIVLPIGLKSDGSIETNRLFANLASQKLFSISLKNRTLKSVLNELNVKFKEEQLEYDITFPFDFEIKEMNSLAALDQILALKGMFGTFEKGTLIIYLSGYRC